MDFNAWCTDKTGGGAIVIVGCKDSPCLRCWKHTVILFLKMKMKIKKTHVDTNFQVGTELLLSAAPFWKKKGGGKLSSSYYFISPSLLITVITMVQ